MIDVFFVGGLVMVENDQSSSNSENKVDAMAVAGGTARASEPLYYAVNAVSELDQVPGIGEKKLAALKDRVRV